MAAMSSRRGVSSRERSKEAIEIIQELSVPKTNFPTISAWAGGQSHKQVPFPSGTGRGDGKQPGELTKIWKQVEIIRCFSVSLAAGMII